ncbi:hypothetical protein LJR296_008235 [Cupriavidus necator]|uniref:DUF5677 domain-containing protein n=1 Tax=Cupriavidus necator TaxID=106590 RepID=UPI003ECC4E66
MNQQQEDWPTLAQSVLEALVAVANRAIGLTVGSVNWSAEAVAVRILLRSSGNLESVIVLAQLGLVADSRTIARCLHENAFGVAELQAAPEKYLAMLKADSEKSRRSQGDYILKKIPDAEGGIERLRETVEGIDRKLEFIRQKQIAEMGPLFKQYLGYQRLSDDAAHLTARSLEHHVERGPEGWTYRVERGSVRESASTLHAALLAALAVGFCVAEMLDDQDGREALHPLAERWRDMPPVDLI